MASHTVLVVADSAMFARHASFGVLMAAIAGVLFIVASIRMAGFAACSVIAVEPEIAVVVKRCRFPAAGAVARTTICL